MKKTISIVLLLGMLMSFSFAAFAHTENPVDFEKEVTVELNSEEEFWNYHRNPNYKYRFIIPIQNNTRKMCWNCGTPNLQTVRDIRQTDNMGFLLCPMSLKAGDILSTYENYIVERCTNCGVEEEIEYRGETYVATCIESGDEYEVRKEWGIEDGKDLHNIYDYWMNPLDYV